MLRELSLIGRGSKSGFFDIGDVVRVKNPRSQSKTDIWLLGAIIEIRGPRNYVVRIGSNSKLVHADHMVKTMEEGNLIETEPIALSVPEFSDSVPVSSTDAASVIVPVDECSINIPSQSSNTSPAIPCLSPVRPGLNSNETAVGSSGEDIRRSGRARKPVVKMNL